MMLIQTSQSHDLPASLAAPSTAAATAAVLQACQLPVSYSPILWLQWLSHRIAAAAAAAVFLLLPCRRVSFRLSDPKFAKYVLPKGFIAVDGCSLTVGEVWDESCFSVYLIPETMRVTVFGFKGEGDTVNIEIEAQTQAIVDTVERVVQQHLTKLGLGVAGAADAASLAAAAAAAAAGGTV
jgi:hypothetical protein